MSIVHRDGPEFSDEFALWARDVADELELRDWTIHLDSHPPKGTDGHCTTSYGRKLATISLDLSIGQAELRHAYVHELIHCHIDSASAMIQNELEHFLSPEADRAFFLGYKRQIEYGVDGLANALAKHHPLPPR